RMALSCYKYAASGNINLPVQLQGYRLTGDGLIYSIKAGENAGNCGGFAAWQASDLFTYFYTSAFDLPLETTETGIRTAYPLHRHGKIGIGRIRTDFYLIQIFQKGGTVVPGHFIRMFCNIVPGSCRYRNDCQTV